MPDVDIFWFESQKERAGESPNLILYVENLASIFVYGHWSLDCKECGHCTELKNMENHQDDCLITVISQQYCNILSVQLLPSYGSHFLAALCYALTNAQFTAF